MIFIFQSLAVTLHTARFKIKKILNVADFPFVCLVWISEQTATFAYTLTDLFLCITEVEGVYGAVRAVSFYKTDRICLERLKRRFC